MSYNEDLANRVRERLYLLTDGAPIAEKSMMGGLSFLYQDKICVGLFREALLCRPDPALVESLLEEPWVRPMEMGGKVMKGWILIDEEGLRSARELDRWIRLSLEFNGRARRSPKRKAKPSSKN